VSITRDQILSELEIFSLGTGGIGSWITQETDEAVFSRLEVLDKEPLTKVQLNQLLVLGHEAPVSDGFYDYYWQSVPDAHPYDVSELPGYQAEWFPTSGTIVSLSHLRWGLYRLFLDGLLWFVNVRSAFRRLRDLSSEELSDYFRRLRFDTQAIRDRGPSLALNAIPKDDRYLISEMACKSYGDGSETPGALRAGLVAAFKAHKKQGGGRTTIRALLEGEVVKTKYAETHQLFLFSADEILDQQVESQSEIDKHYAKVAETFIRARRNALENTRYYLSMVGDLDVYVATSMRSRADFRAMAEACDTIFGDPRLKNLNLRYFDPTLSAAAGHEDKGLIECLMVKCAKVLVYCAGDKESYGKDAEAAMALSLGKPVIFYCDQELRGRFYREVHPLSRLIEFSSGVPVGAMVTDSLNEVTELLLRLFENRMQYRLERPKPGYLRLKESLTDSVVRLQTNDTLLNETLWNHYHALQSATGRA